MPDSPEALEQNLVDLANQCGMDESVCADLVDLALMDPDQLQAKIDEIENEANYHQGLADANYPRGNHLLADVLHAAADGQLKQAALLRLIQQAKVGGQALDQQELFARMQSFNSAVNHCHAAYDRSEEQQRLLFQAELNAAIGPELIEMGFSPEEVAVVIKAITEYSLEDDLMAPTVENAEKVARAALENLKNNNFIHQQPGLSPSEFRIQSAAQRCLGMKFVQGQDGNVVVARPNAVKPLNQDALNGKIEAAKVHVYENGAQAVIGERAQRAGENVKRDLNNRPKVAPAQQKQIQEEEAQLHKQMDKLKPKIQRLEDEIQHLDKPAIADRIRALPRGGVGAIKKDLQNQLEPLKAQLEELKAQIEQLKREVAKVGAPKNQTVPVQGLQQLASQPIDLLKTARNFSQRDLEGFKQAKQQADAMFARMGGVPENISRAGINSPIRTDVRVDVASAAAKMLPPNMDYGDSGNPKKAQVNFRVGDSLKNPIADRSQMNLGDQKLSDVPQVARDEYKAAQEQLEGLKKDMNLHSDPARLAADSPRRYQELQKEALDLLAKMEAMREKNPGLKQLDSNKVGQAIQGKERLAAKGTTNRIQ